MPSGGWLDIATGRAWRRHHPPRYSGPSSDPSGAGACERGRAGWTRPPDNGPTHQFHSAGPHGYAAARWSGSTGQIQVRFHHPLGIIAIPTTQPCLRTLSDGFLAQLWPIRRILLLTSQRLVPRFGTCRQARAAGELRRDRWDCSCTAT